MPQRSKLLQIDLESDRMWKIVINYIEITVNIGVINKISKDTIISMVTSAPLISLWLADKESDAKGQGEKCLNHIKHMIDEIYVAKTLVGNSQREPKMSKLQAQQDKLSQKIWEVMAEHIKTGVENKLETEEIVYTSITSQVVCMWELKNTLANEGQEEECWQHIKRLIDTIWNLQRQYAQERKINEEEVEAYARSLMLH